MSNTLAILGQRPNDVPNGVMVRAVSMYVLATRQGWPARLTCGVASAAGLVQVHAWFEAEDCAVGELQSFVQYREQFSLENRPTRRVAPTGSRLVTSALRPSN